MKNVVRAFAIGFLVILLPALGWAQATDRSEMDQWMTESEHQGDLPVGTTITTSNWQQYKQFLPLGMVDLFSGKYFWKMPQDAELEVGPAKHDFLPSTLGRGNREIRLADYGRVASQWALRDEQLPRRNAFPQSAGAKQGLENPRERLLGFPVSDIVNSPNNVGSVQSGRWTATGTSTRLLSTSYTAGVRT
jgi:hypothetical protein